MVKKYVLQRTGAERAELEQLVKNGNAAGWQRQRAQAFWQCDQGPAGPGWTDARVAQAFGCTTRSPESWRQQAVESGPRSLRQRQPRLTPPLAPKLADATQARLTALAGAQAPSG